jgi:hypothetical protein
VDTLQQLVVSKGISMTDRVLALILATPEQRDRYAQDCQRMAGVARKRRNSRLAEHLESSACIALESGGGFYVGTPGGRDGEAK